MRQHSWPSKPLPLTFILLVLAALVIPAATISARLCNEPLDISGTTQLPSWLAAIKERDEFAFPAHAALGSAMDRLGCQPMAAGLQWLKAAAHARSAAEFEQAARRVAKAAQRSAADTELVSHLCQSAADRSNKTRWPSALETAGIRCGEPPPEGQQGEGSMH